jgi:sugar O-acyltransferase (sialic acid O-acetyltransferase NeuD family)
MGKIIVFGLGQTSEIVDYYLSHDSAHQVVAYTVDEDHIQQESHKGKPVVPFEQVQETYPPVDYEMFIAIGYADLNKIREKKYIAAKVKGYTLVSYISSRAGLFTDTPVGDNCFILEHQSVQPFSRIGNNCFVWGGTLIAHHATIRDHCWIASEASIAGNSTVGERCFLGINSTIGHMVDIGNDCVIGAGALVTKSAPDGTVFITKSTEPYKLNSEQFLRITKMR